eukprot:4508574-Amphidinium_carterae.1
MLATVAHYFKAVQVKATQRIICFYSALTSAERERAVQPTLPPRSPEVSSEVFTLPPRCPMNCFGGSPYIGAGELL